VARTSRTLPRERLVWAISAGMSAAEIGWIDILALFDAGILYLICLGTADRRDAADRHEKRMRALPINDAPMAGAGGPGG
jgi:hypothetical protein